MNVMNRRLISSLVQLAVLLPMFLLSSFQAHGETYLDGNVIVVRQDGVFTPYLAMTDNLGSYLAVVDSLGNKVFDAHYDAWGRQHDVTVNSIGLHRGYCGHEMLDEFRLINMNARLYSPYVGRFLAPDNYVQAPENTQSFNRYSYCLNNPLKYVDPDGNYALLDDLIAVLVGGTVNGLGSGFQHRAVQNSKVKLQEVNPRITFGQNENQTYHTFRHIDELHLNRESVKSHVMKDLKTLDVPQGLPVNRIIYVDGIKLQYTVFKLDNGTQNVGRIHAVK